MQQVAFVLCVCAAVGGVSVRRVTLCRECGTVGGVGLQQVA